MPKFYIIVTETQNNKRQTSQGPNYLRGDGGLTSDTSQAVQIYEWSGQLFTMNGAPNGTYFANVTVETVTLASQPSSSLTSDSIAGHFSLGKELLWENESFTNSHAIFALSPEGMVKAIFDGKHPPNVKVVALVLTRVANEPAFLGPSGRPSKTAKTIATPSTSVGKEPTSPRESSNDYPATNMGLSSSGNRMTSKSVTPKVLPAISNTKLASLKGSYSSSSTEVTHSTSATLASMLTPTPASSSSCAIFTDTSDGGLPITLGLSTLASPPNWPFSYIVNDTTFVLTFGTQRSAGSLAYAEMDPSVAPGDSILYYQLNPTSTTQTSVCETWGYLYHQQSGLCLTAMPNITPGFLGKYEGGHVALEPCMICNHGHGLPEADQLFCAVQENGALGKRFCMKFMEDIVEGLEYGVLYQEGVVPAVLEEGGGDCIYVAAL